MSHSLEVKSVIEERMKFLDSCG